MILIVSKEERELVQRLRELKPVSEAATLTQEIITLKREVVTLEVSKSKMEEEFDKKERELRHMVGLEQRRQEAERSQHRVEIEQATTAAKLTVREENLEADKKRFEEQLAFNTERFTGMEKYLKDMMGDILKRLPNVNMEITKKARA